MEPCILYHLGKEEIILKLGSVKAQEGGQEGVNRKLLAWNRRIPHSFAFLMSRNLYWAYVRIRHVPESSF